MTSYRAPGSISVLMPTWQGIEFLDRVVVALRAQRCPVPWDVLVIDSGSTDGTVERLREHASGFPVPLRVASIPSFEFDHGDTRNLLAARSDGELLVYLTQDAIPSRSDWLERLLANFDDPKVGAVTCGNVPRDDALPSTRVLYRDDPGYSRERRVVRMPERDEYDAMPPMERRMLYAFQNVAAAVRRDLWERSPFPRTMMGEDVLMARGLLEAGFDLVLDPQASVDHSHDYPPEKLRWRGEVDGRFNAEWLDWVSVGERADVPVLAERLVQADLASIADPEERAALEPELRELRVALVEGLYEGGTSPRRYARSQGLPKEHLTIIDLLPELPADDAAPMRLRHALATAAGLLDRGHTVTVAAPAAGVPAGSVDAGQAGGVRTALLGDIDGWRRLLADTGVQIVRVPVLWADAAPWIASAIDARAGVVVTVDDPAELGDEESELSVAVAAADRIVATSPAAHAALKARRLVDPDWLVHARRGVDVAGDGPLPRVGAPDGADAPVATVGGDPAALELEATRRGTPVRSLDGLAASERAEVLARSAALAVLSTSPGERQLWEDEARFHGARPVDRATLAANGVDPDDARTVVDAMASNAIPAVDDIGSNPITLREEVRELEFRLRGVAARDRDDALERGPLLAMSGESLPFDGEDVVQANGMRVVQPGAGAFVPFHGVPPGPAWLIVRQLQLHVEKGIALGGTVVMEGREVGVLAPSRAADRDVERVDAFPIWIPADADGLRIEARTPDGAPPEKLHVRIVRALITRRGPSSSGIALSGNTAPERPDLLSTCRALEVPRGRVLEASELPRVTVVVPTFDGLHDLRESIPSLLDVDYPKKNRSVLVVDNGSSDGTADWLAKQHGSVTTVTLDRNHGFAGACNRGVEAAADADVVVFVNNDMRFEPDFLSELVSPIARGECDATTAKRLSWDGTTLDGAGVGSTFLGIAVQPDFGEPVPPAHEIHRRTLFACGGAMAIRRDVFLDCSGFDEDFFAYYEDLDLGWRMSILGHDVHYVPSATCHHHHSATSRRFPPEVVRRMVIRNSIATCAKNYGDAHFRRVLPAVLGLAIERAFLKSDLETAPFDPDRVSLAGQEGPPDCDRHSIDGIGAADLVALHDVLGRWPEWMAKRDEIQSRRRRPDSEVFPMFLDPLACVEGDRSYAELQADLVRRFGIDRLFR